MKKSMKLSVLLNAAACVGLLLFAAPPAAAEPTSLPTDPVLEKLIADSFAARPEIARAEAVVKAERERIKQAKGIPDPMLTVGIQNDGFRQIAIGTMPTSYVSIMLSQSLLWPGKLGLRSEVAELSAKQATQTVERARLATEAEVRRLYLELVLARDRLALVDRLEGVWRQSAALARSRYEAGGGAQSDVLRSQLEVSRIKQRRLGLERDLLTFAQALNRSRGAPLDAPLVPAVRLRELPLPVLPDEGPALAEARSKSPELAAAKLLVTERQQTSVLATRDYHPDLVFGAGVMLRGALEPMWQVSVGTTLPIFAGLNQNRRVAETKARVTSEEKSVETVEQLLRLRIAERRAALSERLETVGLYTSGLLVQSQATAQSTLAQYEVGKVSFALVLEANAGVIADEDGYLQALADAQRIAITAAELRLDPLGAFAGAPTNQPSTGGAPQPNGGSTGMNKM